VGLKGTPAKKKKRGSEKKRRGELAGQEDRKIALRGGKRKNGAKIGRRGGEKKGASGWLTLLISRLKSSGRKGKERPYVQRKEKKGNRAILIPSSYIKRD